MVKGVAMQVGVPDEASLNQEERKEKRLYFKNEVSVWLQHQEEAHPP